MHNSMPRFFYTYCVNHHGTCRSVTSLSVSKACVHKVQCESKFIDLRWAYVHKSFEVFFADETAETVLHQTKGYLREITASFLRQLCAEPVFDSCESCLLFDKHARPYRHIIRYCMTVSSALDTRAINTIQECLPRPNINIHVKLVSDPSLDEVLPASNQKQLPRATRSTKGHQLAMCRVPALLPLSILTFVKA